MAAAYSSGTAASAAVSSDFYSTEMMITPSDNDANSFSSDSSMSSTSLTTVQLVALSNIKLNNDLYSNRSLSIHKRILVKNMLTFIYRVHPPIDWAQMQYEMQKMQLAADGEDGTNDNKCEGDQGRYEQPPPPPTLGPLGGPLMGKDEQKGWIDRTLQAAGLADDDDDDDNTPLQQTKMNKGISSSTAAAIGDTNTIAIAIGSGTGSGIAVSTTTTDTAVLIIGSKSPALPRPKSAELPQSLHSYLSTVFDVDWSVGLPSTEDLLFTQGSSLSTSPTSPSPTTSGLSGLTTPAPASSTAASAKMAKRKSITAASGLSSVVSSFTEQALPSMSAVSSSRPSTTSSTSTVLTGTSTSNMGDIMSLKGSGLESRVGSGVDSRMVPTQHKPTIPSRDMNNITSGSVGTSLPVQKSPLPKTQSARYNPNSPTILNSSISNENINTSSNASGSKATHDTGVAPQILPDGRNVPVRKTSISKHSKPMLVPGRRSSLHQNPGSIKNTSTSGGISNNIGASSTSIPGRANTSSPNVSSDATRLGAGAGTRLPSLSPTLSPSLQSSPASYTQGFISPSSSPTLSPQQKPTFSRRTSSLPTERPKPIQRAPSSENTQSSSGSSPILTATTTTSNMHGSTLLATTTSVPVANIIGLPRPILNPSSSSSLLSGSSPPTVSSIPPTPSLTPLSRPTPTYMLKASKSSPCLVSGNDNSVQGEDEIAGYNPRPPIPEHPSSYYNYYNQSESSTANTPYSHNAGARVNSDGERSGLAGSLSSGLKSLARSSSRRIGGGSSDGGSGSGKSNISGPLQLLPEQDTSNGYNSPSHQSHHHHYHGSGGTSPYGGGGNRYAQSMSNISVMSTSSVATNTTLATMSGKEEKSGGISTGRWSSMKSILGLKSR
ncbi:hypothetical protein FBU30_010101 [Linnemannia zychae]|nr:hypothetical protein FBU30_010101 [Linnemannia zychae]